jgi:hypothetical protein
VERKNHQNDMEGSAHVHCHFHSLTTAYCSACTTTTHYNTSRAISTRMFRLIISVFVHSSWCVCVCAAVVVAEQSGTDRSDGVRVQNKNKGTRGETYRLVGCIESNRMIRFSSVGGGQMTKDPLRMNESHPCSSVVFGFTQSSCLVAIVCTRSTGESSRLLPIKEKMR